MEFVGSLRATSDVNSLVTPCCKCVGMYEPVEGAPAFFVAGKYGLSLILMSGFA